MISLPNDPMILLSVINMKLRDSYSGLDELCEDMEVDREMIEKKLEQIDYRYDEETNQFI
ncbi:DUF4250 domain-containing protein [bacterium]|uniref:DUF4250 domain-containing protein n=1 Tax=Lachnospiraceae TaxID=186803 RepID=UPI002A903981|nr:DUF4250 domain-containing protein [bacterium]MDD7143614.1 DUF4250 domain-containing protein [bacterium]MDY4194527.1 DUF4250 domain-containing protein [Bariatricus sp.]MDY4503634.1 DUF4250 domain-containing protein [Bariatricus sp.]MDY5457480.1 DUF4250 domain-containing protein [Bariatricus sp.]